MRLGRGISVCITALASAAVLWVPGGASACACGELGGVVVARGHSLYGVPWRIKASLSPPEVPGPRGVVVHFSISSPGVYGGVGYFTGLSLPLPSAFDFTANGGSEIDRYPESDLSGITRRRVANLVVKMSEGESLTIHPALAPPRLRKRFDWLRGLRFFDTFFPAGQEPQLVTAFDRGGKMLARHKGDRGSFH
jgi:hypothetical protein